MKAFEKQHCVYLEVLCSLYLSNKNQFQDTDLLMLQFM